MYDSANPYLTGNYAPWREEGDAFDLEIEGELPRELNGALYRIGPNPHFKPLGRYHWFDGDGMVHAFILRDGRAAYRNRYVRTDGLKAEMKKGRALFGGLLEQPRELAQDLPPFKNAAVEAVDSGFTSDAPMAVVGYGCSVCLGSLGMPRR